MDPLPALARAIHLFGAVAWFGGALAMNVVVLPAVFELGLEDRRAAASRVFFGFERIAIPAAVATVFSGIVIGIGYGRIRSPDALATPYGIVWLVAIAVVGVVLFVGSRISSPAARRLFSDDSLWLRASDLASDERLAKAIAGLRRSLRLELVGLAAAFLLMELLATRF